jgi:hypothetical protein
MPEMDTPVADASWIVVVAPRPVKPGNYIATETAKLKIRESTSAC